MREIQIQLEALLGAADRLNRAQYQQEKHMLMREYHLEQRDLDSTAARLKQAATAHAETSAGLEKLAGPPAEPRS